MKNNTYTLHLCLYIIGGQCYQMLQKSMDITYVHEVKGLVWILCAIMQFKFCPTHAIKRLKFFQPIGLFIYFMFYSFSLT